MANRCHKWKKEVLKMNDSGCIFTNIIIDENSINTEVMENLNAIAVELKITINELLNLIAK